VKKILVLLILVSILSVSAFAQLTVGAYTQSFWIPYRLTVPEEGDIIQTTAVQTPWGGPDISAGINFDGYTEWGGIHLGVDVANGASNQSANWLSAKGSGWVWVKPLNIVPAMESFTIFLGNPSDEHLMGKIGGSNLATYVLNASWRMHNHRLEIQNPQYNLFTRFNPYPWGNADTGRQNLYWPRIAAAAFLSWEPVENLFIGAYIAPEQFNLDGWSTIGGTSIAAISPANGDQLLGDDDINQDYYNVDDVYRKIQVGAGYNMPGIGFVRAQYVGIRNTIEFAFQVTALGDLVLDIGAKIPFEGTIEEDTGTYKKRKDFQVSVAATFRYYDFRLLARVDTAFAGSNSDKVREVEVNGLNLIAYIVPSYNLSFGTVGLDLGFEYEQADEVNKYAGDNMQAGAALWLQRNMGSATFKVAAVARFPLAWNSGYSSSDRNPTYWNGSTTTPFELLFPIYLMVGF